jgi:hypothetical protein
MLADPLPQTSNLRDERVPVEVREIVIHEDPPSGQSLASGGGKYVRSLTAPCGR